MRRCDKSRGTMVKNRQRIDDLIDVLVWIRRRVKRSAAKRKRAKTGASLNRERRS
jgi:hypothetical protein